MRKKREEAKAKKDEQARTLSNVARRTADGEADAPPRKRHQTEAFS